MNAMDMLKTILWAQLFFTIGITTLSHSLPADTLNYVQIFSEQGNAQYIEQTGTVIQNKLQDQIKSPIVELGALVFYSSNVFADLLLNFLFAVPEMFTLLIWGISRLMSIDPYATQQLQLFIGSIFVIMYILGIMQMIINTRSRGQVV